MKKVLFLIALMIGLQACEIGGFYKSIEDIQDGVWNEKNEPTFVIDIKDKTESYDLYYYIRNATQYPYSNLYISRQMTGPDKEQFPSVRNNIILFDAITGNPLGEGLGDIWDHKILVAKAIKFNKVGKFTIKLRQDMRQDPLPFVMSVGISLEKTQ